ncbi:hypothetical protein ACTID9_25490 [Brevibacillus fluminis]|uniref:hypothetical protein n=1 Tax=Brevibacillus fluminis TaxID=511487 RepID=UPI003F8B5E55
MGSYRDIEGFLREKRNVKILILDTNNIQFFYQNREVLTQSFIFEPYDMVLIPGWVRAEYAHHDGKVAYILGITPPLFFVEESEDYLPMIGYMDKRLMELFRVAAPFRESQRFFSQHSKLEADELPDDWIELYYDNGFFTRQTGSLITKKNAGEVSILTLAFLLLSHYPNEISNISIATSDFGIIALKKKVLEVAKVPPLQLNVTNKPPISYLSTDVALFNAVKAGIIRSQDVSILRPNPKSSIFVENFDDGSSGLHETVVDTPSFLEMCSDPDRYKIVF